VLRIARFALIAVVLGTAVAVAQPRAQDEVVELRSGAKVVVRADGTMVHYDAHGDPVPMEAS
jgi:hypothetical protein